ncbi:glycoside hydrolase family 16 protein [Mucilaginibacter sp. PAMB04274]|uniref:glycoside hydrolase family 16 protein n=1 Tax=Mucilaginibacter sp. PAMB04274 TaxID=3138568 RepID=UPI0031F6907B
MKVLITLLLFLPSLSMQTPVSLTQQSDYKLVWSDEFNKDGAPNPDNWTYEKGFVRNHELQWYSTENARCKGGKLIIEAKKDTSKNPIYDPTSSDWKKARPKIGYTSASINTSGKHQWQYGRFEMRARFDVDPGLWPAFWTLGVNGEWPSCGEIDIMEYYRGKVLANIACGTLARYKARWFSNTKALEEFKDKDWAQKFHTWKMDWDEQAISLYVDDQLLNSVKLSELENASKNPVNPFKQPHYILLNLALGGDNGGDPKGTPFPRTFEIDYVRVYQKEPNAIKQ